MVTPSKYKHELSSSRLLVVVAQSRTLYFVKHPSVTGSLVSQCYALEHPWLAMYHDESYYPYKFEQWCMIEELETLGGFREVLRNEISDYQREVGLLPYSNHAADDQGQGQDGSRRSKSRASPTTSPTASLPTEIYNRIRLKDANRMIARRDYISNPMSISHGR